MSKYRVILGLDIFVVDECANVLLLFSSSFPLLMAFVI
jgi:hypothetical protein